MWEGVTWQIPGDTPLSVDRRGAQMQLGVAASTSVPGTSGWLLLSSCSADLLSELSESLRL